MKDNYGWANGRAVKKLEKIAKLVEDKAPIYASMTDEELTAQTQLLKQRYNQGETLDQLLPDAFAVCREASTRVLGQRHYHVQILGGIALHQGRICQMATGEGKTLTETLPAYLNALSGKGVHIVTVNEYLASRDAEWMGKIYKFLGLTVGVTLSKSTARAKRAAYACDVTYGTNNEFGFDYLRDNMATSRAACVQRELNFAIIDEVDSILIDEARTPLIISGPSGKSGDTYVTANRFVCTLAKSTNTDEEGKTTGDDEEPNGDYVVDNKNKTVRLTDSGITKAERFFKLDNYSDPDNIDLTSYVNNALRAHAIMHRDSDYIVEKGQIIIVDTFTGRKMEGRRFNGGLHQAIEAKEHVTIKEENKTLATVTFQNYFRLYHKLSGMTGTAKTEENEFNAIYNIDVVCIPTNLPMIRQDAHDKFFANRNAKLRAIVEEIKQRHQTGQPLLVGTVTVEKSEELSDLLKKEGIPHNVLNAKFHKREAEIVAQAGRFGAVTIATNMAGRGTDILLGGNAEFLAKQQMARDGYTDEQIDAATSHVKGNQELQELQEVYRTLYAKYKEQTDEEKQRVIAAGGLCVIGTERHDSRRIDDQLRGRSGRQGDPGRSVFYISADDDMIRIFGDDRIKRIVNLMAYNEDEPIEMKLLTKSIEIAQKRIEGLHFSGRKNVLQYDDVNNRQRKIIYAERNRILDGDDVHAEILAMVPEYARHALEEACSGELNVDKWNLDKVNDKLSAYFVTDESGQVLSAEQVTSARQVCDLLAQKCTAYLNARMEQEPQNNEVPFAEAERFVLLRTIDKLWMDHIDALDDLRQGVGLQAIGQHDPLMVYKKEAYEMFEKLNDEIKYQTIRMLTFSRIVRSIPSAPTQGEGSNLNPNKSLNGPCPCGSGKKYKNCCYAKDVAASNKQSGETATEQQSNKPLTKKEEYALKRQQRKENKNK